MQNNTIFPCFLEDILKGNGLYSPRDCEVVNHFIPLSDPHPEGQPLSPELLLHHQCKGHHTENAQLLS